MEASIRPGALCAGFRATPPSSPGRRPSIAKPERVVIGTLAAYLPGHADSGHLVHRDTGERVLCTMLRECGRGC